MGVKVADIMSSNVVVAHLHFTVSQVRSLLQTSGLRSVPVVNGENEPVGVVSARDLLGEESDGQPVSKIMTEGVRTIPQYNDVSQAARTMRNNKIHHLFVTHEKELVGVLSSFDLLQLVEGRRFEMKQKGTPRKKRN